MKEVTVYYAPERMVFKDPADALAVDKGPADHVVYYSDYVEVSNKLQTAEAELVELRKQSKEFEVNDDHLRKYVEELEADRRKLNVALLHQEKSNVVLMDLNGKLKLQLQTANELIEQVEKELPDIKNAGYVAPISNRKVEYGVEDMQQVATNLIESIEKYKASRV